MTSEKNRIQEVLETSNIKLSTVISDVFGVSGKKLLEQLMSNGYIDQEEVEQKIDGILINYQEELALLITMPGIKKDTAAVIIEEIGVDMKQFPTSKHLAS